MDIWNIKNLKEELKAGLNEKRAFLFFILLIGLYSLGAAPVEEKSDYVFGLLLLITNIVGYYYIFKCNGGIKGKNFLERAVSLTIVYGVRFFVMFILPLSLLYGLLLSNEKASLLFSFDFLYITFDTVFSILVSALYFWGMGKHVKEVAQATPSESL